MKQNLSELAQVNIHLRNEKTKYNNQKNRAKKYEELYKKGKQKILELHEENINQKEEIERHKQTIEEYKRMIFHKKSKNKNNSSNCNNDCNGICNSETENTNSNNDADKKNKDKKPRDKESYQKDKPKDSEITDEFEYKISKCPECLNPLFNLQKYIRYIEDIDATFVSGKANKTIIKEIIRSGFCKKCRKNRSKKNISKVPVIFGENIRMFINFQITVMKMAYSTTKSFLKIMYGIDISDGEISNILERESLILIPEYERLRKRITSQKGVHFDETGWIIQQAQECKYAWGMTGTETRDVLLEIGIGRGGGAVKMLAQNSLENEQDRKNKTQNNNITKFVGISDGYGGYTNKFGEHALCWAHPNRKLRDLSESKSLNKEKLERCIVTYEDFSKLYSKLRDEIRKEEVRIEKGVPSSKNKLEKLKNKLMNKLVKITKVHKKDPKKLITYKESLTRYKEKYFVCILVPGIPADNNKAERALRHLVLKRKMCNGSISTKSAKTMSINYSVLLSLYWKSHSDFFEKYKRIRDAYSLNIEPE